MAFKAPALRANYSTEEDEAKQRTGGGVTDAYTSPGQTTPGAPEGKTPGTGFVNLQSYLDANKDAGAQMADESTKDVQNAAKSFNDTASKTAQQASADYTKAAGADKANEIVSGLKGSASSVENQARDFLGAGVNKQAGDYTAGLSATADDLKKQLNNVTGTTVDENGTEQDNLTANLQKTYGATGPYTSGFANLDKFIVGGTEGGRNKLNEVKNQANDVAKTYDTTSSAITTAEKQAKDALAANQKKIKDTASQVRSGAIADADAAITAKNDTLDWSNDGVKRASYGDVVTDAAKRADLDALSRILGTEGLGWNSTFDPGVKIVKPEPIKATGGTGSNSLPGANAMGGVLEAGDVLANAAKQAKSSPGGAITAVKDVTNAVNKASGNAADQVIPGAGKVVGPQIPGVSVPVTPLPIPKIQDVLIPKPAVPKLKKPKW